MLKKNRRAIPFKISLFQDKLCIVCNIILYLQKSCIFFQCMYKLREFDKHNQELLPL